MTLRDGFDPNEEHCKAMLENGIDVRSYLEIVDRLAERLGGEKEYRRAARMIYETMLDTPMKDPEPTPESDQRGNSGDKRRICRRATFV